MEVLPLIKNLSMVDGHAHSLLKDFLSLKSPESFHSVFTESRQEKVISSSVPLSMSYRHMIRTLKETFNLEKGADYLEFRRALGQEELVRKLFEEANISTILVDDGFSKDLMMPIAELESLTNAKTHRILRIEIELAELIRENDSIETILEQFQKLLEDDTVIGLKTIAAYRGGLNIEEVTESAAKDDINYFNWQHKANRDAINIDGSRAHHYLLSRIFLLAAEKGLPVQIHCGMGDQDLDLHMSNPALMSHWFKHPDYSKTEFVLLHCYPYVSEAAYLASTYSNVHMDLSLAPFLVSGLIKSIYIEALAAAPYNKIMAGTDGHSMPEAYFYGAMCTRSGLSGAIQYHLDQGTLESPEVEEVASMILADNAKRLYGLL